MTINFITPLSRDRCYNALKGSKFVYNLKKELTLRITVDTWDWDKEINKPDMDIVRENRKCLNKVLRTYGGRIIT